MTPECAVQGCDNGKPVESRGMCQAHYARWRRTGDLGPAKVSRWRPEGTRRSSEYRRDWHLRNTYGLSLAEYRSILMAQGGGCAVCGGTDPGNGSDTMPVDHDHDTGRVRGILCGPCNKGIGHLGDDPDRLLAAAAYLIQTMNVLDVSL